MPEASPREGNGPTAGRVSVASNAHSTIKLGYDRIGNAVIRDQWFQGLASPFSANQAVALNGKPITSALLSPVGTTALRHSYDSLGRDVLVQDDSSQAHYWELPATGAETGGYDALDRITSPLRLDDGLVTTSWAYNFASGLLSGKSINVGGSTTYSVGQMVYQGRKLTSYVDQLSETAYSYSYDTSGRLSRAEATSSGAHPLGQSFRQLFTFNPTKDFLPGPTSGNLEAVRDELTGHLTEYGFLGTGIATGNPNNAGPDAPTNVDRPEVVLNDIGQRSFSYDLLNRLTHIGLAASGTSEDITYDPLGHIAKRRVGADLTHPADALPSLLAPVLSGEADMVVGDRHSSLAYSTQNKRRFHVLGNDLVRWIINLLYRTQLHDIMSGYRVFTRRFVENYPILCQGFELETEMTLHALDKRFRVVEVPISYAARPEGSHSKLNTLRDGVRVLRTIFSIFRNYRPLAFFGLLSLLVTCLGVATGVPPVLEFIRYRYVYRVPSAILAMGMVLLGMLLGAIGLILDTVVKLHRFEVERSLNSSRERRERV